MLPELAGEKERTMSANASLRELTLSVFGADLCASHRLAGSGEVSIGRGPDAAVRIAHVSISRHHARLFTGPELAIEDLGSTNGTRVGGRRVPPGERRLFSLGEPVELGALTAIVHARSTAGRGVHDTATHLCGKPLPALEELETVDSREPEVVVEDPKMIHLHELARRVAPSTLCVLLLGETGTGKEILAETIHRSSPRRDRPFLRLNCAALSESLLESELFGHEKGAFSGAIKTKAGLLEIARGGTVFLDEIGEMPASLQAKLLRVLEEYKVRRVGGLEARAIDVRFVSATNRDLEQQIARGAFRADLFYRLNGLQLAIPPLRARVQEIEPLARAFVRRAARAQGDAPPRLSTETLEWLKQQPWPGNLRELKNVLECAVLLCKDGRIEPTHLQHPQGLAAAPVKPPDDGAAADRQRVIDALNRCAGNQTHAARLLGVSRTTLVSRILEYGLPRPRLRRRS
jgi:transcriptional regulator with GAF, ATPase, and Fis domain